jgi:hypothetical protein
MPIAKRKADELRCFRLEVYSVKFNGSPMLVVKRLVGQSLIFGTDDMLTLIYVDAESAQVNLGGIRTRKRSHKSPTQG